jgi:hypothetical protein
VEKNGTARHATYDYIMQRMRFACCRTRATNTHSEHEILTAFPWQHWFGERASMLHYTYVACCYCFLAPTVPTELLFFHWLYILGWVLTFSLSFCHFILDCPFILQFQQPTRATSSNSSHHLNFGLPLFLHPFPPGLVQRTFFPGSLASILLSTALAKNVRLHEDHLIGCWCPCLTSLVFTWRSSTTQQTHFL